MDYRAEKGVDRIGRDALEDPGVHLFYAFPSTAFSL